MKATHPPRASARGGWRGLRYLVKKQTSATESGGTTKRSLRTIKGQCSTVPVIDSSLQTELPGMPEPAALSEAAILERDAREYEQAVSVHGPLLPPAVGSRLLNVSQQAVGDLMKRRKLTRLEFFGSPWIPVAEIRARLTGPKETGATPHPNRKGRPKKIA